jgi:hypothetical protein
LDRKSRIRNFGLKQQYIKKKITGPITPIRQHSKKGQKLLVELLKTVIGKLRSSVDQAKFIFPVLNTKVPNFPPLFFK